MALPKVLNKFRIRSRFTRNFTTQRDVQEVRIPVSQGYLAGKWWGPTDRRPIVAIHGWQDNCGSFDTLIPLLPKNIPILALDMPGHGYSYKVPAGIPYHNSDFPIMMKELIRYFGWNKVTFMGHSLGAIMSYTYSYLFPKEIDFLICIDGLHPLISPKKTQRVVQSIEEFIKYDALQKSNVEPPTYTIDELMQRWHEGTRKSVRLETAKYIVCRNVAPSKKYPGKYYFSRDARLKVGPLVCEDPAEIIRCASNITFPLFITKAIDSPFFSNETMFKEVCKVLVKSSVDYQFHEVPGTHHVHLNDPDVVAPLISKFIEKHDRSDRGDSGFKDEIIYGETELETEIFTNTLL